MVMNLAEIRDALVAMFAPIVADGGEAVPYFPDAANLFPLIWIADARGGIRRAMSDVVYDFTLPVTCAVARKAVYAEERAAATPYLSEMIALVLADYQIGGLVTMAQPGEFAEGVVGPVGGEDLVGFTLFLKIHHKEPVV
jgi:hypothetical protein